MSTLDEVRASVHRLLSESYPQTALNEFGSLVIRFTDTMVVCKFRDIDDLGIVVTVDAPVLLEVPECPELYQIIAMSAVTFPYGSLSIGAGDTDTTLTVGYDAPLFGEDLNPEPLQRAIRMVHDVSIQQSTRLQPLLGGFTIFHQDT